MMCIAKTFEKSEIDKLPETIMMWKVFSKIPSGTLASLSGRYLYDPGVNVAPKDFGYIGYDTKGFHCFMNREDARRIRNAYYCYSGTIRKVLVKRSDVVVLGSTEWIHDEETDTAIVTKLEILPTSKGR